VLDDSTDETRALAAECVASWRARGLDIHYVQRPHRAGFKAGALENGLRLAKGELVAVFDADFVPDPDFLRRTVHFFTDPGVGMVQVRWEHLNRGYSALTECQGILLDGHFVIEHTARNRSGAFFNFNGTAGILRKAMIDDAGGWQHDTLTEDSDLSYRAQLKGWRFVYVPSVACLSEMPVDTYGFQVQQSRWAKGLMQVALKLLPAILRARIPARAKFEAFMHLSPNISYPMMILVSALMLPVMVVRFYMGWMQMVFLDLPLIIAAFWSIAAFYLVAQRELHPQSWKRAIWLLPALVCAGVGLTIINARAVLEACFGIHTAFARTPKYAIAGQQKARLAEVQYRRKSGWLPFAEIACGTYFLAMIGYAIDSLNFLAVPFLLLFVGGYYWFGFSTLWQEYQGLLRFRRMQREQAAQREAGAHGS
jgi:cellulose synthase/poly-beta-1,6-N-acetylglucosamine synthase-like glycosyltransferase